MLVFIVLTFLSFGKYASAHIPIVQPAFNSSPMEFDLKENDTVFLPCIVDNIGESFVRWWKNRTLLSDSSDPSAVALPKHKSTGDGMLIEFLEPEDAGEYICEVVRPEPWSSLRLTHKLRVLYPPKLFLIPTDGYVEVVLGERVRIGCSATGVPTPVITWRQKNEPKQLTKEGKKILNFEAGSRSMSGIYQCEADNGIGDSVHGNIILRILDKPEVIAEKVWVHSAPGLRTTLICRIIADPEARVDWLFNDEQLKTSPGGTTYKVSGSEHFLQFKSVTPSDFGNYTCQASNSLGTSSASIQLSGIANPANFKKAEGKSDTDLNLIWEVESYSPIIEYKLLFREKKFTSEDSKWISFIIPADGFPSGPVHSKSYTLSGLDKFGVYEVKVFSRNRFGWSPSSEIVTFGTIKSNYVEDKIGPEIILSLTESSSSSLHSSGKQTPLVGFFLLFGKILREL